MYFLFSFFYSSSDSRPQFTRFLPAIAPNSLSVEPMCCSALDKNLSTLAVDDIDDYYSRTISIVEIQCVAHRQRRLTLRLQAGTTNQEPVNVRLKSQALAVRSIHGSSVKNTGILSGVTLETGTGKPLSDLGVGALGLFWGGSSESLGSNSPIVRRENKYFARYGGTRKVMVYAYQIGS